MSPDRNWKQELEPYKKGSDRPAVVHVSEEPGKRRSPSWDLQGVQGFYKDFIKASVM